MEYKDLRYYQASLATIKSLLNKILLRLEKDVNRVLKREEENVELQSWLYGSKETALSTAGKLLQLIEKTLSLEQLVNCSDNQNSAKETVEPLNDTDWGIVERFIQKKRQQSNIL